jgi:hypothetical protein
VTERRASSARVVIMSFGGERMIARKARSLSDLTADPGFHYHVGQLIGAMQMASHVLTMHDDAEVQEVGRRLYEASGWFFEGGAPPIGMEIERRGNND